MKSEARKKAKEILAELDGGYCREASEIISQKVINSAEFQKSRVIFVYVSTEKEPDTFKIINAALNENKTVCVPKCVSSTEMKAVVIGSIDELQSGKFGIKEPADASRAIGRDKIDLAVVPCISAAPSGKRLGHGAGYYDRFLEKTHAFKMCLCFGKLISDDIPTDEHDVLMDKVVAE